MAYIRTIEPDSATGPLVEAYETVAGTRGTIANILKVHSVSPRTMLAHLNLYRELLFGPSELSRAERETIAVAVSVTNRCPY